MVVYVVKITDYDEPENADVYGVYSSLALAGRAAMQALKCRQNKENSYDFYDPLYFTFLRYEEPWGYSFDVRGHCLNNSWQFGIIEIGRVTLNE